MTRCIRCGDTVIHGAPNRFQIRAHDYAESSGTLYQGRLCVVCWNHLLDFIAGRDVINEEVPA